MINKDPFLRNRRNRTIAAAAAGALVFGPTLAACVGAQQSGGPKPPSDYRGTLVAICAPTSNAANLASNAESSVNTDSRLGWPSVLSAGQTASITAGGPGAYGIETVDASGNFTHFLTFTSLVEETSFFDHSKQESEVKPFAQPQTFSGPDGISWTEQIKYNRGIGGIFFVRSETNITATCPFPSGAYTPLPSHS
jgi:hypothetical protein